MSAARMKVSPISTARTPAASSRSTSARVRMPLSLTRHTPAGSAAIRSSVCSRRVWKGAQIAVVDADETCAAVEHARQIGAIVQFDEGLQPQFVGLAQQARQRGRIENLGDQQDGVGAGGSGFEQLIAVEKEVLAQQRKRHGGSDGSQIAQVPLKGRLIGQDTDAGGAVLFVDAGDGDGIEIGAEQSGGGRRLLDLGDDPQARPVFEGGTKVAGGGVSSARCSSCFSGTRARASEIS